MTKKKKKTEYLQVRVDPDLKAKATEVFEKLGLTTSQAIKVFLTKVVLDQGVPFEMTVKEPDVKYKAETEMETLSPEDEAMVIEALKEYERGEFVTFTGKTREELRKFFDNL